MSEKDSSSASLCGYSQRLMSGRRIRSGILDDVSWVDALFIVLIILSAGLVCCL